MSHDPPPTSVASYDVIARVQASGLDELGRLIVFRIQAVTASP
jgi:hypothetical protein